MSTQENTEKQSIISSITSVLPLLNAKQLKAIEDEVLGMVPVVMKYPALCFPYDGVYTYSFETSKYKKIASLSPNIFVV